MSTQETIQAVRIAKDHFSTRFRRASWCRGIGIARRQRDGRFVLRVNVAPDANLPPEIDRDHFEGVPIDVVRVDKYKAR